MRKPIAKHKKRKFNKSSASYTPSRSGESQTSDADTSSDTVSHISSPSSTSSSSCKTVYHHLKEGINWAPKVDEDCDVDDTVQKIKDEIKERVKDRVKLNAIMEKTFARRREYINTCPPVNSIIELYPALEVLSEFQRIVKENRKEFYEQNLTTPKGNQTFRT